MQNVRASKAVRPVVLKQESAEGRNRLRNFIAQEHHNRKREQQQSPARTARRHASAASQKAVAATDRAHRNAETAARKESTRRCREKRLPDRDRDNCQPACRRERQTRPRQNVAKCSTNGARPPCLNSTKKPTNRINHTDEVDVDNSRRPLMNRAEVIQVGPVSTDVRPRRTAAVIR